MVRPDRMSNKSKEIMKELKVLFTCSNIHVIDAFKCLRDNEDGRTIRVYCTNSCEWDLPSDDVCDGSYLVPKINEPDYIPTLLDLCEELQIDVVMPISSIDLDIMSENKKLFEDKGIHVSVLDKDKLSVTNNKLRLHELYGKYMPKEVVAKSADEAKSFIDSVGGKVCCKLSNLCGGKGFAVLDNEKACDIELFHRFGKKHYITTDILCKVVENKRNDVILQEYHEGLDYTVSVLADKGKVVFQCGYVGYLLEFGSIMYGEIKQNDNAMSIVEEIVRDLELDGNLGFDFILKEDGSVVLLERNPRFNASLPFVAKAGCNMPYYRCKQLIGEVLPEKCDIKEGYKMKKYFGTRYYI